MLQQTLVKHERKPLNIEEDFDVILSKTTLTGKYNISLLPMKKEEKENKDYIYVGRDDFPRKVF